MFRFTPRQLEVFIAVSKVQSFRKAAEGLRISPASVSEQVRQLEEQLGTTLFKRSPGRALEISNDGSRFLSEAVGFVERGMALGRMFERTQSSKVRTFIGVSLMEYMVSPMLSEFVRKNSDIDLKLLPHDVGFHLEESIARQEVDCVLVYRDKKHPKGPFITLDTAEAYIYVNKRLARNVTDIDLQSLPYVTCNAAPTNTDEILKLLEKIGIENPGIFAETNHFGMAVQLAGSFDCGLVILPFAVKILDREENLVPIKKVGDWERRFYLSPRLGENVRTRLLQFFKSLEPASQVELA